MAATWRSSALWRSSMTWRGDTGAAVTLTIADATHAQSADSVALTQHHVLAVQSAAHIQTAQSPWPTSGGLVNITTVFPAAHLQTAESPTLVEVKTMAVQSAAHAQASQAPVLTVTHPIAQVFSAAHGQKATGPTLVQNSTLQVESCRHYHEVSTIRLEQYADAFLLVTPTTPIPAFTYERLISYLNIPVGITLLVDGGAVSEVQFPTQDEVDAAGAAYIGGHEYVISPAEAAVLSAAGYGSFLYPTQVLQEA